MQHRRDHGFRRRQSGGGSEPGHPRRHRPRRRFPDRRSPSHRPPENVQHAQNIELSGVVDVLSSGSGGFLRSIDQDFQPGSDDCSLPPELIRRYQLATGMPITVLAQKRPHRHPQAVQILKINEVPIDQYRAAIPFDKQISIDPHERFVLTPARTPHSELSMRVLELFTPIGKGQRGLIVAPPRTGKTTLLLDLTSSVSLHHPEVMVLAMLIDERPEEVTHFKRAVHGSVISSSSDKESSSHLHAARMTLEMARFLAATGKDVFLVMDSLTRLGRASNREEQRGKTMSGGIGSRALEFPRRLFGSARKLENGGSLTIIATVLIDTGSRMDEVIFQEFKGTGNMELVLDRRVADRRIFPAMNMNLSGTRKEEKLLPPDWIQAARKLRNQLSTLPVTDALEVLLDRMQKGVINPP